MIDKPDEFSRRILNFPAIRPCESVSFSALLDSLIYLGQVIGGYKSRTFCSNKRNAKNVIRLIEDILIFLQEIRNGQSRYSSPIILSLSELHLTFQKVQYLLEDCTSADARLWTLVKADKVCSQFQILVRSIALAMDVLPLEEMNIGSEVREVFEFVRKQALKSKFEVEVDDRRAMKVVFEILDQFEGGIAPEPSDLRWVLEYLGIGSWSSCHRELKFLEEEIGVEWETAMKRDVGLLSGLMAFMTYCRCTAFEVVDSVATLKSENFCSSEKIKGLNSDDFRCPITLEFMSDPVTIATGHTYDRASILKWFRGGNPTCPKTGERLKSIDLVPNLALKRLIKQYCSENGIPFNESGRNHNKMKKVPAASVASEQVTKLLARFLVSKLVSGTNEEQNRAAYEIRLLTKTSIFNRSCLVEAGAIRPLLHLLASEDSSPQENATACLLNLSKYSKSMQIIVENGGLALIIHVLGHGQKAEAREQAAGTLFYLASVEEYHMVIGENPQTIPALMELLRNGSYRGKKNALATIFGLLVCPDNHWKMLGAGLVPLLVDLLRPSEREDLIKESLAVLLSLAGNLDGTMSILCSGCLPIVVDVLNSSSTRASKDYCVSLLLALCINGGEDAVPVLVKNPSLMEPLYSLLYEGNSRASKKASSLIRILHQFNEQYSSGLMASALHNGQYVHVR